MTDTNLAIDTRQQILDAAVERIVHYGYAKTTMSEIARDCSMSAGNIYRFFSSKLDIAEAMADRFNKDVLIEYGEIANSDQPAPTRLRLMFELALLRTFEKINTQAKILEVAEVLKRERPEFINSHLAGERVFIVQILEDGAEAGTFRALKDADQTAEYIQSALMKFRFPQLFTMLDLPALQVELKGVINLLLAGLSCGAKIPPRIID